MNDFFPKDLMLPPKEEDVEVCVFGPGYGESIIIYTPTIGWGIIDSCVYKTGRTRIVLPLQYLKELFKSDHPALSFVLLTHPHEDHYKGLEMILDEYPGGVKRVCCYHGQSVRELKVYLAQQRIGGRNVLPGLIEVFNAMKKAKIAGSQVRNLSELTTVFEATNIEIEGYGKTDISLVALSPSASSVQEYNKMLFDAYGVNGEPILPLEDRSHNLVSVAVILRIGALQIVLGSDLENRSGQDTGWNCLVENEDCPTLWANIVKVAHHGSEGGFHESVWQSHCKIQKPLAIITPFIRGSVLLPNENGLGKLRDVCSHIGVTGKIVLSDKIKKHYSRSSVMAINQKSRSFRIVETPQKIGFIRVRLRLDGTITERIAVPPANWIQ